MDEQELEELRQQMLEMVQNLDINRMTDSEDGDVDEDDDGIFGTNADGWYQPVIIRDADEDEVELEDEYSDEEEFGSEKDGELEWYEPVVIPDDELEDTVEVKLDQSQDDGIVSEQRQVALVDEVDEPAAAAAGVDVETEAKKKKRSKKKKKKRNFPKAEDDELEIEVLDLAIMEELYHPQMSADSRFRLAMEKFRNERNFTVMSSQILAIYFTYGGMDEHPETVSNNGDAQIETEVDFCYVVASFLSSYLINSSIWYDLAYFVMAPKVIASFLKYVLVRRVLPEYEDSLRKAIDIAEVAKTEAPRCQRFNAIMPDDFNLMCSIYYVKDVYHPLPDNAGRLMDRVLRIRSVEELRLKDTRMNYARVVRVSASSQDQGPDALTLEVVLKELSLDTLGKDLLASGSGISEEASEPQEKPDYKEQEWSIHLAVEAAALLQPDMVVWGAFYTLSNGMVFARPLVALPSFFVPQDDEELLLEE
ncbi:hypothetical protein EDD11_005580 [Mortierella claussenii]|nr:hypothetical protein EDD11_005580 [Mortierella claussenii]